VLLEGRFLLYDDAGHVEFEETYKYGLPELKISYRYDKTGKRIMKEIIDFTKPYDDQVGSFFYLQYGENDVDALEQYFYGKLENGKWDIIR
jgi:hypothetical protein